eukprot:COSAG01_NODE_741_length_13888_cov_119.430996_14_plen_219_part_00
MRTAAENCRCMDTVSYAGVMLNAGFGAWPFGGTTIVRNTSLDRAGGPMWQPNAQPYGALTIWAQEFAMPGNGSRSAIIGRVKSVDATEAAIAVTDLRISDSTFSGVQIRGPHTLSNTTLRQVQIMQSATFGLEAWQDAVGAVILDKVSETGSVEGAVHNGAPDQFSFSVFGTHCLESLKEYCGAALRASKGNCFVCCGEHQHVLKTSGCTSADIDAFC